MVDAAFGATPGRWPLPPPVGAVDRWHRAVALGGQGYYRRAHAELQEAQRSHPGSELRSLISSTAGSLHRQLGWHAAARTLDGQALVEAARAGSASAGADALVGLAADALGTGRLALSARLLDAGSRMVADSSGWRSATRLSWVRAELALARDRPVEALDAARAALAAATTGRSVRHRVKSTLLIAAAMAATGSVVPAAELARTVVADCRQHRLLPLQWAAAMLCAGLGDPDSAALADRIAADIAERGAYFRREHSDDVDVLDWPRGPAGYC
ncbi:hypothetical protein KV203_04365 [Skermania piniformis]|uniref:Uncharacterized protein n=1 Tax=Skermania pinensis TaxID=39122 RepID=A0ABX8SCR5_9ACTN|nr:hypothetical protein KV203_04365 [Skermania piniformis]